MKSQFFLLTTAIILVALLFLVRHPGNYYNKFYAKDLGKNFENEVIYIANHFNYSYIGDFVEKFSKKYVKNIGYNFSYICWANVKLINISACSSSNSINCCYYNSSNQVIYIPQQSISLLPVKPWVCFQYNITGFGQKYEDFFCT